MTPDERNILQAFLADLAETPAAARDPEADAMIQQAMQRNPAAAYLLVQHAILSDQALHAAQAQLQAQQQAQPAISFLPQPAPSASPWAGPQGAPVQSSPFAANSGLGSFLRSAGQMAAGVAAGDLLAQGISNIFSPRW
ncbi:MAG TPA: DUF2076 family protein [Caulobacteraceae bacterium]|jgi:hypothetical protein